VANEPTEPPTNAFPDAIGPIPWVRWPSGAAPRYWLGFGTIDLSSPKWGLVTMDGAGVASALTLPLPKPMTRDALREWLEPLIGQEAAQGLVTAMARARPERFVEGA
jgi:hypothetical protein